MISDEENFVNLIDSEDHAEYFNTCNYYDNETLKDINYSLQKNGIRVLHLNIRGIQNKLNDLNVLLNELSHQAKK